MTLRSLLVAPLDHLVSDALLKLFVRVALAAPFFLSGRTKIDEGTLFSISDTTYTLFENDYAAVPFPPHFAALTATVAEHLLPLLLLLGLGTRVAALGLFVMTMVIQLFVYPAAWWGVHMSWVALALAVIVLGPGRWSLDALLFQRRQR
ncbi:MAG: DoxX family protein [Sphingomicrobium sp.]